jgi:hypothetical protein
LYSITKHAMRRSADEIGATSISFRPKVFSDPASVIDCAGFLAGATDPSGEAVMFTDLDSMADHHFKDVADSEYSRMISWLRRTCEALTQPATYQQHHFIHSPRWAYHHCNKEKPRFQKGNCWR